MSGPDKERPNAELDDATSGSVRTFVCIEVPDSIKERIAELQERLKKINAPVSWTKPSNIHLTLKFLGSVPSARLAGLFAAVERAAAGTGDFEIEVGGAGCFPSPRSPRVLWIGLGRIPQKLNRLYTNLETELNEIGFARETRPFSPHLTIGRVRDPRHAGIVGQELVTQGFDTETFRATEVIVMRSDLNPKGSIYTRQATIAL